jgi:hypothetical protein
MKLSEHELEVAQQNGEAVRRVISDPIVTSLFSELEQRYFRLWQASQDVNERELIFAKASALSDLGTAFQAVIDAGTLATHELEQRDK